MSNPPPHAITEALYREHHSWLRAWLGKKLGCSQQATDLAQDTFVRVLQQKPEGLRSPRAYLSSIARNVMVDWFRRRAIELAYLEAVVQWDEPVTLSPEASEIIIETLIEIDRLLDSLNARSREIFLLVQLDGMSFVDISRQLGLSVTSVRKHFIRALAQCLALVED